MDPTQVGNSSVSRDEINFEVTGSEDFHPFFKLSKDLRKILEKGEYNSMEGILSYYIDVLQGKTARKLQFLTTLGSYLEVQKFIPTR